MSEGRPFGGFERMVALRYLRTRRREGFVSLITWFSLAGIALGVAALIIVMSVMNGMRDDLLGRVLGFDGHIIVEAETGTITDYEAVAERVRAVPEVVSVTPVVEGHVLASSRRDGATGAVLRGMPAEELGRRARLNMPAGAVAEGEVVLGGRLSRLIGAVPGDTVSLTIPRVDDSGRVVAPHSRGYPVAGLFRSDIGEFDGGYLLAPIETVRRFFAVEGASYLEVFVTEPEQVAPVRAAVAAAAGEGLTVRDWRQRNATLFNALQIERRVTFVLLTLIVLVAAFNIISSLVMLVKEKGRDIAILRTIGATQGMVMRVFFLAGASVGVTGTLVGLALGLVLATNVEAVRALLEGLGDGTMFAAEVAFLASLPSRVDPAQVVAVAATALVLSFSATLYPAWRAARLDPVEALRNE